MGSEPQLGEGVDAAADAEPLGPSDLASSDLASLELALPKRTLWPFFVVLAVAASVAGWFVWRAVTAPAPTRVLVAIDVDGTWWEGSAAGAMVADDVAEYLRGLGFSPVRAGDPEVEAVLEDSDSALEAAEALGAAFIITGELAPEVVELPVPKGYHEVRIDGVIEVRHLGEDEPLVRVPVRTFAGARAEERALDLVAGSIARHVVHGALPTMIAHESIQALKSDPKLFDEIAKGRAYADSVQLNRDQAARAYDNLAAKRQRADEGVTFVSPVDAQDRLLAVGPEGLLVATGDAVPFFTPKGQKAMKASDLEAVALRPAEGDPKVLWRGYQAFTYPSASRDGRVVALVESFYGYAFSLTVLRSGNETRRLFVTPDRRLSEPRLSPGGKAVAFVDKACKRCPREIAVRDVVSGRELQRFHPADHPDMQGDFRWLDDRRLLLWFRGEEEGATRESEPPALKLWAVDVTSGEAAALFTPEGSLHSPTPSADGKHLALADDSGAIVIVELESGEAKRFDVGARPSALAFSPDGDEIAFEAALAAKRQPEIGLLDRASGQSEILTDNDWPDRFPIFSPDGERIYFEARNDDPALSRRQLIRAAWLPVP